MKRNLKLTSGLALPTFLFGCVVKSVFPFYTAKDVVFDPALVGVWEINAMQSFSINTFPVPKLRSRYETWPKTGKMAPPEARLGRRGGGIQPMTALRS